MIKTLVLTLGRLIRPIYTQKRQEAFSEFKLSLKGIICSAKDTPEVVPIPFNNCHLLTPKLTVFHIYLVSTTLKSLKLAQIYFHLYTSESFDVMYF